MPFTITLSDREAPIVLDILKHSTAARAQKRGNDDPTPEEIAVSRVVEKLVRGVELGEPAA